MRLALTLGLSRPTVRAAFLYLANKGLVVRKRDAGTVVASERIDRDVQLTSLYDDQLVQLDAGMLEEHGLDELLRAAGLGPYSATQRIGAKNASAAEALADHGRRGSLSRRRLSRRSSCRPPPALASLTEFILLSNNQEIGALQQVVERPAHDEVITTWARNDWRGIA